MKALASLLMLWFVFAGITSCQLREIGDADDQAHISIDVDWSLMDEDPTGMTVIFYPEDGSKPYQYVTNDVHHIEQNLPEKEYEILIFNQSVDEFSTLNFRGLDKLETAEVYIPETKDLDSRLDRLYRGNGRGYSTTAQTKPRSFGGGKTNTTTKTATRGYQTNSVVKPDPRIGQLTATIHVKGLDNAVYVNGALTSLAGGTFFGKEQLNEECLTQEMEHWSLERTENSIGVITTTIGTFGLSQNINYKAITKTLDNTRYTETSEEDDYRNILYLNFLLKDNTYVSYRFDVTNYIQDFSLEAEVKLVLDLGTDLEEYLELPETGLPYKSTPVSVSPWNDEPIEHKITLQ